MGILGRIFRRPERQDSVGALDQTRTPEQRQRDLAEAEETLRVYLAPSPDDDAEPSRAERVKRVMLPSGELAILDLRSVQANRTRIVGSAYWVTMAGREKHGGMEYLLVREPKNKWDKSAVAVYGKGRKVGHLSEKKAAAYAPILDALDFDAFTVGGASVSVNSSQLWVDLPSLPALRAFAKAHEKAQAAARTGADA